MEIFTNMKRRKNQAKIVTASRHKARDLMPRWTNMIYAEIVE